MTRLSQFALAVATLVATIQALPTLADARLSLSLKLGSEGEISTVQYSCVDGTDLSVQYINAEANSLAVIPLKGAELIFVNVVAGSGARYVSGPQTWWVKGDEATLSDQVSGVDPVTCAAKGVTNFQ